MFKAIKIENALRALKQVMPFCSVAILLVLVSYMCAHHIQDRMGPSDLFFIMTSLKLKMDNHDEVQLR